MGKLSIFIDESGDFGEIKERPAFYQPEQPVKRLLFFVCKKGGKQNEVSDSREAERGTVDCRVYKFNK